MTAPTWKITTGSIRRGAAVKGPGATTVPTSRKKKVIFCAFLGLLLVVLIVWLLWPRRGTLTGTVSFRGKPVPSGSILLITADSKYKATAWIQKDGTYKFTGVPVGEVKLAVFERTRSPGTAGMIQMMGGTIDPKGKGQGGGFSFVLGGGRKRGRLHDCAGGRWEEGK